MKEATYADILKPVNFFSLVLGIFGFLFAAYTHFKSDKIAQISYATSYIQIIDKKSSEGLRVLGPDDREVEANIFAIDLVVWNSGDIELDAAKIRRPLSFRISDEGRIIDAKILSDSAGDVSNLSLSNAEGNTVIFKWSVFDPRQAYRTRVLFAGSEPKGIEVKANILGVSEIQRVDSSYYSDKGRLSFWLVGLISGTIVFVVHRLFAPLIWRVRRPYSYIVDIIGLLMAMCVMYVILAFLDKRILLFEIPVI